MSFSKVYFNFLNINTSKENVPSTLIKSLPQVQGNSSKVPHNARIVKLIISDMNQEEKNIVQKNRATI